jgi:hypothetical protein
LPFAVTAKEVEVPFTVHPFAVVKVILYAFEEYTPERFDEDEQLAKRAEATPVADERYDPKGAIWINVPLFVPVADPEDVAYNWVAFPWKKASR